MVLTQNDLVYTELESSRKVSAVEGGLKCTRSFDVAFTDTYRLNNDPEALDPEWLSQNFYEPETGLGPVIFGDEHPYYETYVKEIRVEPCEFGCKVEITYEPHEFNARCDQNGELYEMDWATKSQHITSTLFSQSHYPTSADFGLVIGADGEEVKGCDIHMGTGTLKITKKLDAYPGSSTLASWKDAIGCVNEGTLMHGAIAAGEALLVGFNPIRVYRGLYLLELNFLVLKRRMTATITLIDGTTATPAPITGPWDQVWFRHMGKVAAVGGVRKRQMGITSVHVAQVYDTENFANLFGLVGPTYAD